MTNRHDPSITKIDNLSRNCTLVAAREVTGKTDEEILRAFLARGYRWGYGTHNTVYINAIRDLGFKVERVPVWKDGVTETNLRSQYKMVETGRENTWGNKVYMTIRQTLTVGAFGRKYKKGTFVVSDGGHAFVIRDGVVVDPNLERRGQMRRRKLVDAFQVFDPAPSKKLVATRLKRNSDPLVRFAAVGKTKQIREVEKQARRFAWSIATLDERLGNSFPKVRLSQITSNTDYTRYDAAWDIRRGRLLIVES